MALNFLNNGYFAGSVGIGTESPGGDLHVVGKTGTAGRIYISDIDDGASATDSVLAMKSGTHGYYYNRDSGNLYLGTNDNPNMMIINSSGDVGIGTTNPDNLLTIESSGDTILQINRNDDTIGGGNRTGIIQFGAKGTWGTNLATSKIWSYAEETFTSTANGTSLRFFTTELGAATADEKMIIDTNGNVGIGTTNPNYLLDVEGSVNNADIAIRINNTFDDNLATSNPTSVLWLNAASNNGYLRVHGAPANTAAKHQIDLGSTAGSSFLTFSPSGAERMRITSTGGISFGSTGTAYGTSGQILQSNGNASPTWIDGSAIPGLADTLAEVLANGNTTGSNDIEVTNGNINFEDSTSSSKGRAVFGNQSDLSIYHDSTNSYIAEGGVGSLYLLSNALNIQTFTDTVPTPRETMATFVRDGAVSLYYDNSKKFETTSTGVTVTGDTVTTDNFFGDTGTGSHRLRSSVTTAAVLQVRPLGTRTGITPIIQYRHSEAGGVKYLMAGNGGTYFGIYNSGIPTDASSMIRLTADNSNNPSIGIGDSGSGTAHLDIGGNVLITNSGDSYLNGGNVGIGTTSPDSKLNINGNSGDPSATYTTTAANSTIGIGDFSASGLRMMFGVNPSTPSTWIQGQYTTNQVTSKLLLNPLGGNVGIGITDPTNLLHIKKSGFTRGTFEADGDNQVGIQIIRSNSSNNTNWEIYSPAASTDLRFFNGGDRLTISSSGAIKFNAYNSTNNTGTPTYLLGTDSSGNIVKTNTVPGSGAGPYLPLAGGTMTGINGVLMPDNFKLKFGDATTPDLEIYHDGSNSYIKDNGTGNLRIRSTSLRLENTDSSNMVVANGGDSVSIYYNGSKKLETTSAGVNVTGDIQIDSALLSNQENTDVDTGTETVASVAIATYTAAFFDFVIKKTTNVRSGTVYACHDGTNVEFTETSTQDLGDTSDVTLSVDISGTDMRLRATTTSDDWSIKSLIRAI